MRKENIKSHSERRVEKGAGRQPRGVGTVRRDSLWLLPSRDVIRDGKESLEIEGGIQGERNEMEHRGLSAGRAPIKARCPGSYVGEETTQIQQKGELTKKEKKKEIVDDFSGKGKVQKGSRGFCLSGRSGAR